MEIGAVKQAFNNEIILLKKNLNQAKIQIIHKLTRRSKQFAEKKGPEKLKEKFKKKAESAINEVLIIKKIKVKDLAKFAITHTGELKDFLNRPNVDRDKCCARLLLHKCLQEKYKTMRSKYTNIEIKDLFLSRIERRKQKKEERESRKKKKNNKVTSADGDDDLSVEDVAAKDTDDVSDNISSDSEENIGTDDEASGNESTEECFEKGNSFEVSKGESDSESENEDGFEAGSDSESRLSNSGEIETREKDLMEIETKSDSEPDKDSNNEHNQINLVESNKNERKLKSKETIAEKKHKDNKNKNLKKKLTLRNFKKDKNEDIGETKMVADPFFITATGENYMSVVDKTETEEFKQGNRRERRAAMFGLAPKIKSKSNNTIEDKFNKQNIFRNSRSAKFQTKEDNSKQTFGNIEPEERSQEKLHPSWAAKKKQSGLLPFQGKKIVFDAT